MKNNRNYLYEGMYIISTTLSEDARSNAMEKIQNGIVERGGEVHKQHDLGRCKLAYDIRGRKEGHYFVLYFSINPCQIDELWKNYHLHEDLLRFMTLRADKVQEEVTFKSASE
ncbi:MAG: 30S ribosomal protein S6 [Chlamydiae bacterium]|nr:30S ribosomal protein S6 [Chlamydiota bacterium]